MGVVVKKAEVVGMPSEGRTRKKREVVEFFFFCFWLFLILFLPSSELPKKRMQGKKRALFYSSRERER